LTTPHINNKAFQSGSRPHRPKDAKLGATIQTAFWNIERGQQLAGIRDVFAAASDRAARTKLFDARIRPELRSGDARSKLETQLDALRSLDVIILNEVDRHVKRSGYADVVAELADELDMNWTWGAEFIEVDPVMLGTERFGREDFLDADATTGTVIDDGSIPEATLAARANEVATVIGGVDRAKSRNLHGNAILSRYPIKSARVIPLETVCWDWNAGEKEPKQWIQLGKEKLAEKIFLEKMMREVRHGGRSVLIADLHVPGLSATGTTFEAVPGERANTLTVVSAHLEAKATPQCRGKQMKEIMALIADIKNPVVFGGDLNTFGGDGRPTTIERLLLGKVSDWQWIARQVIGRLSPYAGWVFTTFDVINWVRLKDDPTGINIPLLLPNPERGLFDAVENHMFADGARFDFRGDKTRTVNGTGKTLANSNQRDSKGFKTTSSLHRTLGLGKVTFVGKWKLDWIFARGYQRSPRDEKASYRMAPHFPRTLEELRDATMDPASGEPLRLSDHAPLTVVLPIDEGCRDGACRGEAPGGLEFGDVSWEDTNTEE
jgi:endonuclease/exonuclease/phosphatase family metal-dependent hydrolase